MTGIDAGLVSSCISCIEQEKEQGNGRAQRPNASVFKKTRLIDTNGERSVGDAEDEITTIRLARWDTRFWAWLIDFILISLVLNIFSNPFHFFRGIFSWDPLDFLIRSVGFLLYWTVMEGYSGQSFGKMVMNLKVTNRDGSHAGYAGACIQSFGKSFILPFDCLIGWFGMPGKKLRLFNRVSGTIVIKTDYREPEGVRYVREQE